MYLDPRCSAVRCRGRVGCEPGREVRGGIWLIRINDEVLLNNALVIINYVIKGKVFSR